MCHVGQSYFFQVHSKNNSIATFKAEKSIHIKILIDVSMKIYFHYYLLLYNHFSKTLMLDYSKNISIKHSFLIHITTFLKHPHYSNTRDRELRNV